MKFDFVGMENTFREELTKKVVGNMYDCVEFPVELVDEVLKLTHELIISKFERNLNIDMELDDLGNVLMVSIIEPVSKSELLNVSYSVKKIDSYKLMIKDVLISIKPYIFENYDTLINKQNEFIENLIKEQIDKENEMLSDNISTEYLSEEDFKNLTE